jgi:hypothetical protein
MTERVSAEQRRALTMLAIAGRDGATQPILAAHGFGVTMIAGLVDQGLATMTPLKVRAGRKLLDVAKMRITAAGRDALAAEG